jgi:uncharacterized protein YdhG (YjbR/CyaY superfamily)
VRARRFPDWEGAGARAVVARSHGYNAGWCRGARLTTYLDAIEEPKRTTLAQLRDTIMTIVPDAEECISYGMPTFKLRGKTIAGFAAFKNHLSYLPHSGSIIPELAKETERYTSTNGSLNFPIKPLAKTLVKKLIAVRMAEAFGTDKRSVGAVPS